MPSSDRDRPAEMMARGGALANSPEDAADEQLIFAGPGSQWVNAGTFFFCAVLAGVGLSLRVFGAPWLITGGFGALAIILAVISWIQVRFLVFRVSTGRIEVERGWLTRHIYNLDLFRVTDVSLRIGLLDRLVGIGDVSVTSSDADTPVQVLRGVPRPRAIYEHLKRAAIEADRRRGVVQVKT